MGVDKIYVASTILLDDDTKYELDTTRVYTKKEINNMNLLFLYPDSDGILSYHGKPLIDNAYSTENLDKMIIEYFNYHDFSFSEIVDNDITDDITNKIVFIHANGNEYSIIDFGDIYDTFLVLRDYFEKNDDIDDDVDIDYDSLDADAIMNDVMKNSVSDEDISILDDIIKKQIDRKNHTLISFSDTDTNGDLKKTVLGLMNNNVTGTILFVHNVAGLSSAFDFYIDSSNDNDIMFVDDTISYIFPHMLKKCFEKSTKMILVVNMDDQIIDNVELKENYIFNMYINEKGKYILENVTISKYKNAFMEQFRNEPLICHYVLCDMKGNQYLTFDDN